MNATALSIPPWITSESSCNGHCTTVLGDDVCRSCLRTFDEITRWVEMNEEERRQVNQRIALLHSTTNPPQPSLAPARGTPVGSPLPGSDPSAVREGAEPHLP